MNGLQDVIDTRPIEIVLDEQNIPRPLVSIILSFLPLFPIREKVTYWTEHHILSKFKERLLEDPSIRRERSSTAEPYDTFTSKTGTIEVHDSPTSSRIQAEHSAHDAVVSILDSLKWKGRVTFDFETLILPKIGFGIADVIAPETNIHFTVVTIPRSLRFNSFSSEYDRSHVRFLNEVRRLLPIVAEKAVTTLLEEEEEKNDSIRIIAGQDSGCTTAKQKRKRERISVT